MNKRPGMRLSQTFKQVLRCDVFRRRLCCFLCRSWPRVALVIILDDGLPVLFSQTQSRKKRQALSHLEV